MPLHFSYLLLSKPQILLFIYSHFLLALLFLVVLQKQKRTEQNKQKTLALLYISAGHSSLYFYKDFFPHQSLWAMF